MTGDRAGRTEFLMKLTLANNKDVWAGLMLIAIGAAAIFIARNYPFGTALRMGPGYFPVVLGGLLIVFGLSVLAHRACARARSIDRLLVVARARSSCRSRSFCSAC